MWPCISQCTVDTEHEHLSVTIPLSDREHYHITTDYCWLHSGVRCNFINHQQLIMFLSQNYENDSPLETNLTYLFEVNRYRNNSHWVPMDQKFWMKMKLRDSFFRILMMTLKTLNQIVKKMNHCHLKKIMTVIQQVLTGHRWTT